MYWKGLCLLKELDFSWISQAWRRRSTVQMIQPLSSSQLLGHTHHDTRVMKDTKDTRISVMKDTSLKDTRVALCTFQARQKTSCTPLALDSCVAGRAPPVSEQPFLCSGGQIVFFLLFFPPSKCCFLCMQKAPLILQVGCAEVTPRRSCILLSSHLRGFCGPRSWQMLRQAFPDVSRFLCHVHGNIMCIKTWHSQDMIKRHPAVILRRYHSSIAEFKCLNKQE